MAFASEKRKLLLGISLKHNCSKGSGIADRQRQLIYELVNTFFRMGERLGEKKGQAGSVFHGMDGRICRVRFFLPGKDHGLPQWHPGFPQGSEAFLYN